MWCPSATLSVWTNSWLAGVAAPDDVLDALSQWAPRHFVNAYDSVAAGRTGLPWPDLEQSAGVSLLQTLRTAAGPVGATPPIDVVFPVPGDVRGLPAGTQFQQDAIAAGEALIVGGDLTEAIGLVPNFEYDDTGDDSATDSRLSALSWTVYSVPGALHVEHFDLGEAEYALRSAVRTAADTLGALDAGAAGEVENPRALVEEILESMRGHRLPEHAPKRAVRVLETAAHVDAITTVSAGLTPISLQSSSELALAGDAMRPLTTVVRSARMAALSAILASAWQ